ncbi:NAD(P)H-dependent oxidoreductase [Spiractinospora alimapuensis]|uniref:NADPH-dependent FMN reductase n=1 Tax=Spiractinospora alimapuensis TaxID=2820884 RepID=UPI001F1EF16B|nr:NAD(P)H-dependent oxidoreductase [Spiractinospora alimapuensis]QVQ53137.1 NAD(P)H-dependent oxidoreductase [Spiractinospora alimapuensis]
MWNVLGICGSLRRNSYSSGLLRAADRARPDITVLGAELAGRLPLFNPDLDDEALLPDAAREFRACADRCDGIIIATPEYAHGPSGATKNAMDWLVGSSGLAGKPTLLMSSSPGQAGGMRGHLALIPTLTLMGSVLVDSVTISGAPARTDGRGDFTDPDVAQRVELALREMSAALVRSERKASQALLR